MNFKKTAFFLFDGLIIILFALFTAYFADRAGYAALQGDGYSHATKIKFLVDYWPNINWVYFWGNGIPVFLWYAIMPYAFLVFFFKIFASAALAIDAMNVLTFILIGIGIYGIVYEITKSRMAALLAAVMTIPLPGLWYRFQVGTIPRTFGDGFLVLSVWFVVRVLKEEGEGILKKTTLVGLIGFTSLAFQSHSFTTLLTGFFDGVIILVVAPGLMKKIKLMFLTFFPAFLLAFYFLGPFILTQAQSQAGKSFGIYSADPMNLLLLVYRDPQIPVAIGGGLLPTHLPLLLLLLPLAIIYKKFKDKFVKRVFMAFFTLFACLMVFGAAIYVGFPPTFYSTGFVPDESFEFLSLVIPVMLGVLFWLLLPKSWVKYYGYIGFILITAVLVVWQYPLNYPLSPQVPWKGDPHEVYDQRPIWTLLAGQENEKNYRFAHPKTEVSLTFNFESDIPQSREFFPQGVLYPNWRSWQENAILNPKWNDKQDETKFLLDWYALKWLSYIPSGLVNEKYGKDPDYELKVKNPADNDGFYEFKKATPILSTTQAPAVLVIGEDLNDQSYSPIVRTLAVNNLNSQILIPVRGKKNFNDYSLEELSKFPLVVLYEYHLGNSSQAGKLLADYISGGGKAIVETTSFVSSDNKKSFEKALGFESVAEEVTGGNWNFFSVQSDLTREIDFSLFSPPLFEGSPWKYLGIEKASLGKEKESILEKRGKVVIFRQRVGKGILVWSGLNLPYHILSYQNQEEAKFLTKIIFSLLETGTEALPRPKNITEFVSPQKRTVEILEPATAILFKENYFFNWRATFEKDGRKTNLKVYPAGLDFMYIPLGKSESSGKVTIFYQRSLMEQASTGVSVVSLLALVIFGFLGKQVGFGRLKEYWDRPLEKSFGKLARWWHKEDEG